VADAVRNILLFLPLGVTLALAGAGVRRATVIAFLFSTFIEVMQALVIAGRDPSVGDLAMNTVGALLGATLTVRWRDWLLPTAESARRLTIGGIVIAIAVCAGVCYSFGIFLPDRDAYYVRWVPPVGGGLDMFHGQLLGVTVAGVPMEPSVLPPDSPVRRRLTAGQHALHAVLIPGTPPIEYSTIFGITPLGVELVEIAQNGRDLFFRYHSRGAAARFEGPQLLLRGVFPDSARTAADRRDTMHVDADLAHGILSLRADVRGVTPVVRESTLRLGPALGWTLILGMPPRLMEHLSLIGAAWLFALFCPLGFWSSRAAAAPVGQERTAWRWNALALASVVAALAALPPVFGYPATSAVAWIAACAGVISGMLIGRWLPASALSLRSSSRTAPLSAA
jgi:hypothetical protein